MVQEPARAAGARPDPGSRAEATDAAPADAPTPRLATRSPALDGLRGVAVALVVLFHSGNSLWHRAQPWMAKGGPLGVHMFFVLSGFLITTLLLEEADRRGRVDLRAFAGRRARRLVPALVGLLVALVGVAAVGTRLKMSDTLASSVYVLTFTTNWRVTGFEFPVVDRLLGQTQLITEVGQTWSLAIEAQFYVAWAVALWFATRRGWTARRLAGITAAVIAVIAVARAVEFTRGTPWLTLYISTWSRLDAPLVGALAALALRAGWLARRPRRLTVAGTVGLAAILVAAFATTWDFGALPDGLYTLLALGVGATVTAVVVAPGTRLATALAWRPLVGLGLISYSMYIWHVAIFLAMERYDPPWPGPVCLAVGLGLAFGVALASYWLIERPLRRRRLRLRTGPVTVTAGTGGPAVRA